MYQLNQEHLEYKRTLRHFVNNEIIPYAREIDQSGKFPLELIRKCGANGFLSTAFTACSQYPSKDTMFTVLLLEELSRGLGALGLILSPQFQGISLLAAYGSEELKNKILNPALNGELLLAYAITEEKNGTNALEITTTAVKDGNDWILNGKKCWITNAGIADGYLISTLTASASKRRSLSFFYVDKSTPGITFSKEDSMLGCSNSIMGTIELNNCRVPASHLIGSENEAYGFMKHSLNQGRLVISATAIGIAHRALELAIDYSNSKEFFGRKLSSHQGVSFPIAEMYAELAACKSMLYHTSALCDANQSFTADAAALKIMANETCLHICRHSIEIHGAYGLSKASDIERCYRDAQMLTTAEGTLSACKMSIASSLIKSSLDLFL